MQHADHSNDERFSEQLGDVWGRRLSQGVIIVICLGLILASISALAIGVAVIIKK